MKERAENVQKYIDRMHGNIDMLIMSRLEECESPIEELFCLALMEELGMLNANQAMQEPDTSMFFDVQQEIDTSDGKSYRVDFLITMYDALFGDNTPITDWETQLIVECDGWEFHSTKEQIQNDNKRDAQILSSRGIPTIRFLGKEINSDPAQCARTAISTLKGINDICRTQIEISVGNAFQFTREMHVRRLKSKTNGEK